MEKIIERNVPIAEENVTLSGQPATNMFEDWSENITETDLLHEEKDKGFVRLIGLEPTRPKPLDPKSSASTNFATSAFLGAKIQ